MVIQLRWPLLVQDLLVQEDPQKQPGLLAELQAQAERSPEQREKVKPLSSAFAKWTAREDVMAHLRAGCFDENGEGVKGKQDWTFHEQLDFAKLLKVSPWLGPIAVAGEERSPPKPGPPPAGPVTVKDVGASSARNPKDGLTYVWIPPGTFWMGALDGDEDAKKDEKPRHEVAITTGFWLSQAPVTVAAFRSCVAEIGGPMPEAPEFNPGWEKEDHPIVGVTWEAAAAYCSWAGGRLPTEAEWEYAARGGKEGLKYPWGNEISPQNAKYKSADGTMPVGSYAANGFGLYDMAGNVWEWCSDRYREDYYSSSPAEDPQGPAEGIQRVRRGGSWFDFSPWYLRCSDRYGFVPDYRFNSMGFRCVREVIP